MEEQNSQKRPRWVPAAVLAGVLVVLVVVALIVRGLTGDQNQSGAGQQSVPEASPETAPAVEGTTAVSKDLAMQCQEGLTTATDSVASEAPQVDEWVSSGYNVVPVSSHHGGCQENESGLRTGFAHTPSGALLAATTYAIAVSPSGINASDRLTESVAEGPDRDQLVQRAEDITQGEAEGADPEALRSAELIGYDQRQADAGSASFMLYLEITDSTGNRRTAAGQVDVVWEDGDWKVDPASGQDLMSVSATTTNPSVEWGPNNA